MTVSGMLEVFAQIAGHARQHGVSSMIYKAIPYPFCRLPAQEDLYALFRMGARLVRRDASSVITMGARLDFANRRRRGANKAAKAGLSVSERGGLESFMPILAHALARHGVKPVHTLDEMELLQEPISGEYTFVLREWMATPKCWVALLVYEYGRVAHAQYLANSDEGRKVGALDLIVDYLLNQYYPQRSITSASASRPAEGGYLNTGLCTQKEEFGGRGVANDFYALDITN